jgi:DNA-directed RNA polymerase subunit RPC12/RpoP
MSGLKKQYLVMACTHCSRLLLATSDKKTRTCPYCGTRVKAEEAQVVARSESPKVARQFLQDAKARPEGRVSPRGDGRR